MGQAPLPSLLAGRPEARDPPSIELSQLLNTHTRSRPNEPPDKLKTNPDPSAPSVNARELRLTRGIFVCLLILTILALGLATRYSKPVLLPLLLALLITLVLQPVQATLCKLKLPNALAAAVAVFMLMLSVSTAAYYLAAPAVEWGETLDMEEAEKRIKDVLAPLKEMSEEIEKVSEKVENIAEKEESDRAEKQKPAAVDLINQPLIPDRVVETTSVKQIEVTDQSQTEPEKQKSEPVKVEVREKRTSVVMDYAQGIGVHITATLLLIFFFLAYGHIFTRRLAKDSDAGDAFDSARHDVSAYLFTITAINIGLGVCIGIAMWLLGMPNPILWGVMATALNFLPYIGAFAGTAVVALVALVTFDNVWYAALIPVVYLTLTSLEGSVVTPMIIGKRFSLNPIIVVVSFLCWGALWGVPGMLIATPTLMIFKVICERVPALTTVNRVISR
ncbi:MAG: hypothetical protein CMO55_06685 [Verrucomicrobiales bacterium]|nr:hypothetical protein [Verrucomicrobiales bacterium]